MERMTWTNQFSEICVGFLGFVITEVLFFLMGENSDIYSKDSFGFFSCGPHHFV